MTAGQSVHTGGCLCGAVRFEIKGTLRDVIACHCSQCRRTSGHFAAMTSAASTDLTVSASQGLTWYRSSDAAERGFCNICGSNLFWREFAHDVTSITAGTVDMPTNLKISEHIFVADKSDYYAIYEQVPQKDQW